MLSFWSDSLFRGERYRTLEKTVCVKAVKIIIVYENTICLVYRCRFHKTLETPLEACGSQVGNYYGTQENSNFEWKLRLSII